MPSDQPAPENLTRPCPSCGSGETRPHWRKGGLQLVQCVSCSLLFANPVPREFASGAFYAEAGGEYLSPDKLESDYADVRFERELRLFRKFCRRGAVLDVGCSSGGFLYQLTKRFPGDYKVLGTDVSTEPLEHAAKMGVPIARGNFLTHPFAESFDVVTFWAVMEHLFEPRPFLQRAVTLLKPGGLCFILVPNFSSLAVRLIGPKYRYIFPEHINYFTAATLKEFVGRELKVIDVRSTHFNPLVIWQDFRKGERDVPRAERSSLLKRTNAYKKSPWLWPAQMGYRATESLLASLNLADNLVIIAKKSE